MLADTNTANERPGIEEQYETASNTSDLSVESHRRGAVDILIAAAWSETRLGGALLRLHSEYEGSEKPARMGSAAVDRLAGTLELVDGLTAWREAPDKAPVWLKPTEAAKRTAHQWHLHETALLLQKLKALPEVREQLTIRAAMWGMEDAASKAAGVIRYWLDQTCQSCDGRKFRLIQGAPKLSNRACPTCQGSGVAPVPHGQEGRKLANYLDSCVHRARQGISNRLHNRDG
ncbi:hypothetical protein GCM10028796_17200 [Ramlibacter monticola]|uniref:Zinc finger-like domain-containing protein n=1 Tax=Ramlibacter monticola TaxID=1926872 RepID=A0A936YXT1_9BURK|nr:zinc finger-like domain-containing protein [Ramlibacter monticola]MBL0390546.1 zinc finger-like domain-containing protein [Ramlibacter monticola]